MTQPMPFFPCAFDLPPRRQSNATLHGSFTVVGTPLPLMVAAPFVSAPALQTADATFRIPYIDVIIDALTFAIATVFIEGGKAIVQIVVKLVWDYWWR
jgi:hypothetical protein